MEKAKAIVIADAGPIIHLDELDSLDLLVDFDKIIVPEAVWQEVTHHRPQALENESLHFIRQKTRTKSQVLALLQIIPTQSTLHIHPSLLEEVIADVIKSS